MASHIHPDPKQKGAAKPATPPAKPVAAKPAAPAKPATAPKPAAAPQAAAAKPVARPDAAHQEQAERRGGGAFNQVIACGISMLVHIVALLSMALIVTATPEKEKPREIVSSAAEPAEEFEDLAEQEPEQPQSDAPQSNDLVVPTTDVSVVPDAPRR